MATQNFFFEKEISPIQKAVTPSGIQPNSLTGWFRQLL
jgi:hypothetical protein